MMWSLHALQLECLRTIAHVGVLKYERVDFVVRGIEERSRPHDCSAAVIAATQPSLVVGLLNHAWG